MGLPPFWQQASARHTGPSLEQVAAEVQAVVAGLVGHAVSGDQPLMEAGLDSLGAASAGIFCLLFL